MLYKICLYVCYKVIGYHNSKVFNKFNEYKTTIYLKILFKI